MLAEALQLDLGAGGEVELLSFHDVQATRSRSQGCMTSP